MAYPKTPLIRRHGTIKVNVVESTPIVHKDNLYRFEYMRPRECSYLNTKNYGNPNPWSSFHFVDLKTGVETAPFARDHHLGCAYTDSGVMYAVGIGGEWGSDTVHVFSSEDLESWEM